MAKKVFRKKSMYPPVTLLDVLKEYGRVSLHYKGVIAAALLGVIINAIARGVIVPVFYKHFFDTLTAGGAMAVAVPALIHIIFLILALNGISWITIRTSQFSLNRMQVGISKHLRQNAFDYVLGHSYAFFNDTFSGSLVQKVNRFMRSFERVTDRFVTEIVPIIVKVIGICIVLWYTQPILAVALVLWMLAFLVLSYFFTRWKLPHDIEAAELESGATAALADSLSNHTTVQLFSRSAYESVLFGGANERHVAAIRRKWDIGAKIDAIQAFMNYLIEFAIFIIAIHYWGLGLISVGAFVLIQIYVLGLMNDFWGSSRIMRDLYESFADAREMVEIMKLPHSIKDVPRAPDLKVSHGAVELKNVQFQFNPGHPVLDGINLNITAGERVAFIGPSGAGKSTLVRLILRLYDIQSGSISIDGQDIKQVAQESLRESISFVPQDPILFHRTLRDNIRYGKTDATDEEVIHAAKLAHCHEFITSFPDGYDTFVGERGVKLSGGERQRVAIARAILKNAPILILDEATSSLDSHSEILIQDALDVLMKGKTVMVIAHRLSTIRKMNRIVVIDHGKVIEQGSHDKLIEEKGLYAKLWSLQSHGFIKDEGDEDRDEGKK